MFAFKLKILTPELMNVLIGTFFGCLGGVVSLLLRLADFENLKGKSRTFLRASGGAQPVIGGTSLRAFSGALISAKIININVSESSDLSTWFFVVLRILGWVQREVYQKPSACC